MTGITTVRFEPSRPIAEAALYAIDGVQTIERQDRSVTLTGTGDLVASLINAFSPTGIQALNVEARRGNLEDAFIRLTSDTAPPRSLRAHP